MAKAKFSAAVVTAVLSISIFTPPAGALTSPLSSAQNENEAQELQANNDAVEKVIDEARESGRGLIVIEDADLTGFEASVANGRISVNEGVAEVIGNDGTREKMATSKVMNNGEEVSITYHMEDNRLVAEYSQPIELDEVPLHTFSFYGAGACAGAIIGGTTGTILAAAEVASAPLTGPLGPIAAAATMGSAAATIMTASEACS